MNIEQQAFLEKLASRIPCLFDVIRQGNIKSEYIIGIRRIGQRQVRLKMVAEVVDPGINPLSSHSTMKSVDVTDGQVAAVTEPANSGDVVGASARRRPRKR